MVTRIVIEGENVNGARLQPFDSSIAGPVDWWTVAGRRIPAPGPLKKDDGAEQSVALAKSLP
jgi:hypothetical protein